MPETCTMLESIIQFSCWLISGHQSIAFNNHSWIQSKGHESKGNDH